MLLLSALRFLCFVLKPLQALKRGSNRNQQEGEEEGEAPRTDWMGRDLDLEGIDSDVLSPAHAARRETILLLPAWVRALRPWGDVLQVERCSAKANAR